MWRNYFYEGIAPTVAAKESRMPSSYCNAVQLSNFLTEPFQYNLHVHCNRSLTLQSETSSSPDDKGNREAHQPGWQLYYTAISRFPFHVLPSFSSAFPLPKK